MTDHQIHYASGTIHVPEDADLYLYNEPLIFIAPYNPITEEHEYPEPQFCTFDDMFTPEGLHRLYKATYDLVQTHNKMHTKVGDRILLPNDRVLATFPQYSFNPIPEEWVLKELVKLDT